MNRSLLLACITMLFVSTSAMALDGKTCEAKAAHMNQADHDAFMKTCLAQMSEPSNVKEVQQQDKKARCEQNAKNQKLQGNEKTNYVSTCMTENEAAAVKKATPQVESKPAAPAEKPKHAAATNGAKGTTANKKSNSCVKQANKKGLKGDARKEFLKDCKPS